MIDTNRTIDAAAEALTPEQRRDIVASAPQLVQAFAQAFVLLRAIAAADPAAASIISGMIREQLETLPLGS